MDTHFNFNWLYCKFGHIIQMFKFIETTKECLIYKLCLEAMCCFFPYKDVLQPKLNVQITKIWTGEPAYLTWHQLTHLYFVIIMQDALYYTTHCTGNHFKDILKCMLLIYLLKCIFNSKDKSLMKCKTHLSFVLLLIFKMFMLQSFKLDV